MLLASSFSFDQIKEYLPLLIPVIIVEFILFFVAIRHVLTHDKYKRGNRLLWMIICIVGINYVGPILYFALGKEDE